MPEYRLPRCRRSARRPNVTFAETNGFYTVKDVCRLLAVSRTTLWRMRKDGSFPEPIPMYGRMIRWPKPQVDEWIRRHSV
ncbi:transcriptional regulator [Sinorhizobium sp. NG07B]|nr:transcriptional regulator [Sinorhizobium sp. NG07B]